MKKIVLLFVGVGFWLFAGINDSFIKSAQEQVGKTVTYNPEYRYIKYPNSYKGLYYTDKLDPNIDHRRVKNIQTYLVARGYRVKDTFKPGDIVVWKLKARGGKSLDHIGICSDKTNAHDEPLIIHNINSGAKEEDVLRNYKIVDHFRVFEGKK